MLLRLNLVTEEATRAQLNRQTMGSSGSSWKAPFFTSNLSNMDKNNSKGLSSSPEFRKRACKSIRMIIACSVLAFLLTGSFSCNRKGDRRSILTYHWVWKFVLQDYYDSTYCLQDWPSWEHKFDDRINTQADAVAYAKEMLNSLGDKYTRLMDSAGLAAYWAEHGRRPTGKCIGTGLLFNIRFREDKMVDRMNPVPSPSDVNIVVDRVIGNSPAMAAKIQVNDKLISVNGRSIDPFDVGMLDSLLNGQPGDSVNLVLERHGKLLSYTLGIAKFIAPSVDVEAFPHGIALLKIFDFEQRSTSDEVKRAMQQCSNARALILDLRDNPGGFIEQAVGVASMFLKAGTLLTVVHRSDSDRVVLVDSAITHSHGRLKIEPRQPYLLGKRQLVVLVNGETKSAAEVLTAALQDNAAEKRGRPTVIVVGTRTFGKGIGQSHHVFPVDSSFSFDMTTIKTLTPKGEWLGDAQLDRRPLTPDIVVPPGAKFFEYYSKDDAAFHTAMKSLN
jgi:C-terminal peptidase prc